MTRIARGRFERGDELRDAVRGDERALVTVLANEAVGLFVRSIVKGDLEAVASRVSREVRPHGGKAGDPEIAELSHRSQMPDPNGL